mmetsp:Transcript_40888/g.126262  ORF Transcript_40888/g.126262 Transcript_40888/m.126262 type:complete len:400 (+) Transcript_40888:181-1380(+)
MSEAALTAVVMHPHSAPPRPRAGARFSSTSAVVVFAAGGAFSSSVAAAAAVSARSPSASLSASPSVSLPLSPSVSLLSAVSSSSAAAAAPSASAMSAASSAPAEAAARSRACANRCASADSRCRRCCSNAALSQTSHAKPSDAETTSSCSAAATPFATVGSSGTDTSTNGSRRVVACPQRPHTRRRSNTPPKCDATPFAKNTLWLSRPALPVATLSSSISPLAIVAYSSCASCCPYSAKMQFRRQRAANSPFGASAPPATPLLGRGAIAAMVPATALASGQPANPSAGAASAPSSHAATSGGQRARHCSTELKKHVFPILRRPTMPAAAAAAASCARWWCRLPAVPLSPFLAAFPALSFLPFFFFPPRPPSPSSSSSAPSTPAGSPASAASTAWAGGPR